jgi:hypothetical protein
VAEAPFVAGAVAAAALLSLLSMGDPANGVSEYPVGLVKTVQA